MIDHAILKINPKAEFSINGSLDNLDDANIVWYQKSDTSLSRPFDISSSDSYLSLYNPSLIYEINFIGDTLLKIDTKNEILHHELTKDINNNMTNIINTFYNIDFNIPLLLESKIGSNWLDTKEIM